MAETNPYINHGKPWTSDDDKLLIELTKGGMDAGNIAVQLGRTTDSVYRRRQVLGVAKKSKVKRMAWKEEDLALLKTLAEEGLTANEIAGRLNRTTAAVHIKARTLGIRFAQSPVPPSVKSDPVLLRKHIWEKRVAHRLVKTPSGCLEWQGALDGKGYGQIVVLGQKMQLNRFALELKIGRELIGEEYALHKCDNPSCCNPDHLFIGDQLENVRDMWRKNRQGGQFAKGHKMNPEFVLRGEQIGISKLTEADVRKAREIYAKGKMGHKRLAKMFGVTPSTMRAVLKRRTWKHVD